MRDDTQNTAYTAFDLYVDGPDIDPFGSGKFDTTVDAFTDPFFDYTVLTIVSVVAGNDMTLPFALFSEFDGRQSIFAVDNLNLIDTQVSAVPLLAGA